MSREIRVLLVDILESIGRIEEYTQSMSEGQFMRDVRTQDAVIRRLEVIGEAVRNIQPGFRDRYPDIPWRQISGMRDVLIHGYSGVNLERVWMVVKSDLPELKLKVSQILE